jgi:hypothetical protein
MKCLVEETRVVGLGKLIWGCCRTDCTRTVDEESNAYRNNQAGLSQFRLCCR